MDIMQGLQTRIKKQSNNIHLWEYRWKVAKCLGGDTRDIEYILGKLRTDQQIDKGLYRQIVRLSRQAERLERSRKALLGMVAPVENTERN